jgi:hypothetical protein
MTRYSTHHGRRTRGYSERAPRRVPEQTVDAVTQGYCTACGAWVDEPGRLHAKDCPLVDESRRQPC